MHDPALPGHVEAESRPLIESTADDPSLEPEASPSARPAAWAVGAGVFALFLVWRFPVLDQPPVWDGAMGMTPAALTLEQLDFDVVSLLKEPDYRAGGPNLHSLSVATWLVAVCVRLFGSYQAALPFLHLVSFGLIGLIASASYRVVRGVTGSTWVSLLAAALAVLFPPMVVQGSDVYLDLPLAAAITWAFVFLLERSLWPTIALLCLATAIKPSGLIALPAAAVVATLQRHPARKVGLMVTAPVAVAAVPLLLDRALRPEHPTVDFAFGVFGLTVGFLEHMPVLASVVLMVACLAVMAIIGPWRPRFDHTSRNLVIAAAAMPVAFLYFFLLNPLVSKGVVGLPRYTTMFTPMLTAGLIVGVGRVWGERVAVPVAILALSGFVVNMHGALEPASDNLYPLAERSLEYEAQLEVQREAFDRFEALAGQMPAFYDHFSHFRFEYPATGWASVEPLRGVPVHTAPERVPPDLSEFPDEFAMLIEGPWLGGQELHAIRRRLLADPAWSVETQAFANDGFINEVVVARRR